MSGWVTNDQGIAGVKSEGATYGVDAFSGGAPVDADRLPFAALDINQVLEAIEGDRLTATIAGECHALHNSHTEVSYSTMLLGSSAAGALPPVDAILRACGFKAAVDVGVSVTYEPITENNQTDTPSCTFVHYQRTVTAAQARRIMARGCRGNFTLDLQVGAEALLTGEMSGLYDAYPSATAALPALPTEYGGDQCAWIVNTLGLTVGGTVYPIEGMTFESRWDVELIRTGVASTNSSVSHVLLMKPKSGSRMGGSFSLKDGATALTNAIVAAQAGSKVSLVAVLTKGSRTITLDIPAVQLLPFGSSDAPTYAIEYAAVRANAASGAGHVKIIFA